jgi:predicted kinase
MEAVILIGIQGSGKSTFAKQRFADTHVRISRDMVRTVHRERVLQYACLSIEQSFVADNTHAEARSRASLVAAARAAGFAVIAYYFPPDVPAALLRNAARSGRFRVPDVAIYATAARLVAPTRREGFDACFQVRADEPDFVVTEMPEQMAEEMPDE